MTTNENQYKDNRETCAYIHVSVGTLWKLRMVDKVIPYIQRKPKGKVMFDTKDLDAYMESLKVNTLRAQASSVYRTTRFERIGRKVLRRQLR
jgi:hypothetical protein